MAYGDFKDLFKRTASDKTLRDKAFDFAKNLKYDGYQRGLASMVYNFFDNKSSGSGIKNENMTNKELTEELHNQLSEDLKRGKYTHLFKKYLGY